MDLYSLLDEIQAIARDGLAFSSDLYDRERYERLLVLATQAYSELLDVPEGKLRERFLKELGYITPKVGVDAAIFNPGGEILLMERVDGTGWCMPCGWIEPNERPREAVVREVREETGLEVEVKQFVGAFSSLPGAERGPHTKIALVHICQIAGGEFRLSHEGLDLRYWPIEEVPEWLDFHKRCAMAAYERWQSESLLPAISD